MRGVPFTSTQLIGIGAPILRRSHKTAIMNYILFDLAAGFLCLGMVLSWLYGG